MAHQAAETDGPGLAGRPAVGVPVSDGPTWAVRGVAMFAIGLTATAIALHVGGAKEWAGIIACLVAVISLALSYAGSSGDDAREGTGTWRDRMTRMPGKRKLIEIGVGTALLMLFIASKVGWLLMTDDTMMIILASAMMATWAVPVAFALRLDSVRDGVER